MIQQYVEMNKNEKEQRNWLKGFRLIKDDQEIVRNEINER